MKRSLLFHELLVISLFLLAICSPIYAQLPDAVGIWLFDEGAGDEIIDSSGHGHTGMAVGGKLEWDEGKIGSAARFKLGIHVEVEHTDTLNLETFTVAAWVKFVNDTGGGEQNIAYKQVGDDRLTRNYTLKMWNGQIYGVFASGGNTDAVELASTSNVTNGEWHHVAMTYDKKTARLYVNGKEEVAEDLAQTPQTNEAPIRIGAGIDGLIDELQLLGVALSAADIRRDMNDGIQLAVQSAGKATTTWAWIKTGR